MDYIWYVREIYFFNLAIKPFSKRSFQSGEKEKQESFGFVNQSKQTKYL